MSGGAPGSPPPYVGTCSLFFESVDAFQAAFGPKAQEILGDIPNYADLQPELLGRVEELIDFVTAPSS